MNHPHKRQKLAHTNAALTKPFRTPLRRDPVQNTDHAELCSRASLRPVTNIFRHDAATTPQSELTPGKPLDCDPENTYSIHTSSSKPSHSPMPSQNGTELLALQKQYLSLARQLTELRQSLDTAQQALHIELVQKHTELNSLTDKWKLIAREAAEELYNCAKERNTGITGLRQRRADDNYDNFGNSDNGTREEDTIIGTDETLKAQCYNNTAANNEQQASDHSSRFTLDKMLYCLQIDPDLLGYDNELERWVE